MSVHQELTIAVQMPCATTPREDSTVDSSVQKLILQFITFAPKEGKLIIVSGVECTYWRILLQVMKQSLLLKTLSFQIPQQKEQQSHT